MNLVRRLFFSTSPRISSSIRVERPPLPASGEREHLWPLLSLIAFIAFAATAPAFATEIPSSERRRRDGAANKSCADCHGDARASMKGVAARYPAFSPALGRPIDLEARINMCRTDQQKATPLRFESKELVGLTAYLALQSRGMPIEVGKDERLKPFIATGRALFNQRQGQINLSCAQCHDDNWGQKLAGAPIPQGHPNGYPVYRLEWQSLGSLQRRLRNCMFGMRAEPYAYGAAENVDLELYLMSRAQGLKMESPAVRP